MRRNYVQIGSLWTATPKNRGVDAPIPTFNKQIKSAQRGSLQLANATMETNEQDKNCFHCNAAQSETGPSFNYLSHIFSEIDPLN